MFSQCRHIPNCWNSVTEYVQGTKGSADISGSTIHLTDGPSWRYPHKKYPNPYQVEHDDLFASIRAGKPINEAESGAMSSMTAILGRMATYSGKVIEWDAAINSRISLLPEQFSFEATPRSLPDEHGNYARAVPGVTKVI